MTSTFGATLTTDDVWSGVNLRGKRILVTGTSAGLGVETASTRTVGAGFLALSPSDSPGRQKERPNVHLKSRPIIAK